MKFYRSLNLKSLLREINFLELPKYYWKLHNWKIAKLAQLKNSNTEKFFRKIVEKLVHLLTSWHAKLKNWHASARCLVKSKNWHRFCTLARWPVKMRSWHIGTWASGQVDHAGTHGTRISKLLLPYVSNGRVGLWDAIIWLLLNYSDKRKRGQHFFHESPLKNQ